MCRNNTLTFDISPSCPFSFARQLRVMMLYTLPEPAGGGGRAGIEERRRDTRPLVAENQTPVSGNGTRPPVSWNGTRPLVSWNGTRPPVSWNGTRPPVSGNEPGPPVSGNESTGVWEWDQATGVWEWDGVWEQARAYVTNHRQTLTPSVAQCCQRQCPEPHPRGPWRGGWGWW